MTMIQLAMVTVTVIAFARVAWVTAGLVRTWLRGGALVAARWGWIEALNIPEPLVLAGVTYTLAVQGLPPGPSSAPATAAAIFGAALARGGLGLSLWAFLSLPSVGGGHYVLQGQAIVEQGVYGWLRHPLYVAAFLIWLAVALAYGSVLALVVFAVYVVPIYLLYIREEERLMIERYGDTYRDYRERVGGLFPRRRG